MSQRRMKILRKVFKERSGLKDATLPEYKKEWRKFKRSLKHNR
jgi:hypothetical protein